MRMTASSLPEGRAWVCICVTCWYTHKYMSGTTRTFSLLSGFCLRKPVLNRKSRVPCVPIHSSIFLSFLTTVFQFSMCCRACEWWQSESRFLIGVVWEHDFDTTKYKQGKENSDTSSQSQHVFSVLVWLCCNSVSLSKPHSPWAKL